MIRLAMIIAPLTLIAALGGCSPGMTGQQLAASDNNKCVAYGFKPDTDAYAQCRQQLDHDRTARPAGSPLHIDIAPLPNPTPSRARCTSTPVFNTVQTECR